MADEMKLFGFNVKLCTVCGTQMNADDPRLFCDACAMLQAADPDVAVCSGEPAASHPAALLAERAALSLRKLAFYRLQDLRRRGAPIEDIAEATEALDLADQLEGRERRSPGAGA